MNDKKVSIIITTYKRADLLDRAIQSALNQTYKNIEVIVVDDNNFGDQYNLATEKMIKEKYYEQKNLKYVMMRQNSGACDARNKGVSSSEGEFINFLDDDDELMPDKVQLQMAMFEQNNSLSVVGCFADIVDENNKIKGHEKTTIKGNVFFQQLCQNISTTSLALIRKDVYIKSGGFEKMYSSQEHWMFAKIYSVNPYFDYVEKSLVRIYHHSGERISTNKNKPLGALELANKMKQFYTRLSKDQILKLEGFMIENIIFSYLNLNDQNHAKEYYKIYKFNKKISITQKIKVWLMCKIGIDNYRKLVRMKVK